jgi:hypothetical protein
VSGPRPFGPDELSGVPGLRPDELAAETRLARDLEAVAARDGITPSAGFADRVMGAIASEPLPSPAVAAGRALRHAALAGFLVSVRDAVRVAFSGGFPAAVRVQAFALVLLVVGLTGGSGYAAAGALGLLGDRSSPGPSLEAPSLPPASPAPTDTPPATLEAPSLSPSPSPSPSAGPTASPEDPTETPDATEDGDDADTDEAGATPRPTARLTARPTATPKPKPKPSPGPDPTETPDHGTPRPTTTPDPTPDPTPTPTPSPTPSPTPIPTPTPDHD